MEYSSCLADGHMMRPMNNYLINTLHFELYFNLSRLCCQLENLNGRVSGLEKIELETYYGEYKIVCIIDPQTDRSMLCPSRNRVLSF